MCMFLAFKNKKLSIVANVKKKLNRNYFYQKMLYVCCGFGSIKDSNFL